MRSGGHSDQISALDFDGHHRPLLRMNVEHSASRDDEANLVLVMPVLYVESREHGLEPGPDGQIRAELKDLGGPLQLQGQLQLRRDGNYELNGHVMARTQASDDLQHWMEMLGPPDPVGMRPFSLGGVL